MWTVVNLIGWTLTGAAVTAMVWIAPGPGRRLFAADAPWQTVVAAAGAAVFVGIPGALLLGLAAFALLARVSGAGAEFARRFERGLAPASASQYPAYLAVHVGFVLAATYWLAAA